MKIVTRLALVMAFIFCANIWLSAQNSVLATAQVIPPYSPYISTYVDQPNKLIVTLQNLTTQSYNLKLWVRIEGDNGTSATTAPGFKPASPITLGPGEFKQIDFSSNETKGYFDAQNVVLTGITKMQLIQNQALPEGNYTACVRAMDYTTGAPLSMDQPSGCTAPFNINYIDPPMAIQPVCGNEVTANTPQSVIFTWTPPATAPGNIQYQFIIKEVPNTINPNDVIKNGAFPVLYTTTVTAINTLIYTSALPALTPGKKYVWRVKAIDPANVVQFKNQGNSEACTFEYSKKNDFYDLNNAVTDVAANDLTVPNTGLGWTYIPVATENQGTIFLPPFLTFTTLNAHLQYHYSNYSTKYPLQGATVRLVYAYMIKENGTGPLKFMHGGCYDGICEGKELTVTKTDDQGNVNFVFLADKPFGLVKKGEILGSGEFKSAGDIYRACTIEINGQHQEFYLNPDAYFMPNIGDVVNAGNIDHLVKDCSLVVTVKRTGSAGNPLEVASTVLANANVYLCRWPVTSASSKKLFPQEDVDPIENVNKPEAVGALEVVGKYHTDGNGKVTFKKIVYHNNPNYRYYIYADFDKNQTGYYNYEMGSGMIPMELGPDPSGGVSINPGAGGVFYQTLKMSSQYPRILGLIKDKFDGKPLQGVVDLKTLFLGVNNWGMAYKMEGSTAKEKEFGVKLNTHNCGFACFEEQHRIAFVGDDGQFAFEDLPIVYEAGTLAPKGPVRCIKAFSNGYDEVETCPANVLKFGEQNYQVMELGRGGAITGKIVDGETGKGLSANFYFIDELKSGSSFADIGGWFIYPAAKKTFKQKLVLSCPGYLTDTLSILVDKEVNDLGVLKMYTLKRRLKVIVVDKDNKSINNAVVEIKDVTTDCIVKLGNLMYPSTCPLKENTPAWGVVLFSFVNAGGAENNGHIYSVKVSGPQGDDYESQTLTTAIPYSSTAKTLLVKLQKATCISGYVYAGKNTSSPVAGAKVKMDVSTSSTIWGVTLEMKTGEIEATTDASGFYTLHNVPLRDFPQIIRAMKGSSDLVGDSFVIVTKPSYTSDYYQYNAGTGYSIGNNGSYGSMNFNNGPLTGGGSGSSSNTPKDNCIHHNFNLAIYNNIDITSLMGFPIEVSTLKPYGANGAEISGYFVSLPGNDQFAPVPGSTVAFDNIKILPSTTIKNSKGIPVATPESVPVVTNANSLPLMLYGQLNGKVEDKKLGIYLDKDVAGKQYGVIKGKVQIPNSSFNQAVIAFSDTIYLAMPNDNGPNKLNIPVINADVTVKQPANAPTGFKISNSTGGPVKFSLPGFANAVLSDAEASRFYNGELNLTAKIQTNIPDIAPSNLNISLANIKLKKNGNPSINSTNPVSFNMGNWKLTSTDFTLNENGLKLNKGTIDAGVTVPFTNLGITYSQLLTNTSGMDLNAIKLAGVHPLTITSNTKSFGLINVGGGKKAWQIYAGPSPDIAASITNLPALSPGQKIDISSISLMSNGQQLLVIKAGAPLTLRNILKFTPVNGSPLSVQSDQFLVPGTFTLNLPEPKTYSATLFYGKSGSTLDFKLINMDQVIFNKPTQLVHKFYEKQTLTNGKFQVSGYSEESGVFPKTYSTLFYTTDSVSVWLDGGQNIPINADKKFAKAMGGMRIEGGQWTPFWFSGEAQGMSGISDVQVNGGAQRMKFIVSGEVTADGQSIQVKNVETPFGSMNWVYDFPHSRLTGHCTVKMDLSSCTIDGQVNTLVDGSGWYFGADGILKLNGLGDVNFVGMFGNYPSYPPGLPAINTGDFKCLPAAFNNKVNGFMLQAGIHKQVVPEVKLSIPALLDIGFGVDVGLTARMWKAFSESGSDLGIALLAKGNAYAHGSCSATCTDFDADANAQVGISGIYHGNNGTYDIKGCGSVHFGLKITQHPPVPLLPCCNTSFCTLEIDAGSVDVGVNLNYNSNNGADMSIKFASCDSQCN